MYQDSQASPSEKDPIVGRVLIDRYRVLALIAEGGVGRVYLAEHVKTMRLLALKVLHPQLTQNTVLVDTFLAEARTVARLGHQNIVEIYQGARTPDGVVFLVME